ncbi:beta-lactamase-like protein [Syncephalis pseudoplumigaleata]|uniref:Beta-lactamase-like protein n=1 Tax=Syncephalis pseudoplumigaleata TaxID=1712513 RepID=A0A4P9YUT3_9FUNG|nr:beta-lactamase-like protein [Syncephalis pseudoplumigaleata]|eukprot:RKP23162.1 beta-lactamase-like protein [Syncephalis pseudoplumigaleata]
MAALTPLANIETLSRRVVRVLGLNPGPFTLQGCTNTYLVGTGSNRLLIDTGEGIDGYVEQLQQVLKQQGTHTDDGGAPTISHVLLTHWHHDHVGGLGDPATSTRPGVATVAGTQHHTLMPVADGDVFRAGDCTLRALHTPGHTRDHLAFYLEEEQALFTGDCVLGEKTAVFEDLPVYIASLERLKQLDARRIYPGHGPMVEGAENVRRLLDGYIEHRLAREQEIVKLISHPPPTEDEAGWTASRLLAAIYPDVPEGVKLAAGYGLLLHLLKLKHDGRVDAILPAPSPDNASTIDAIRHALELTRLPRESIPLVKDLQWTMTTDATTSTQ